MALKFMCDCWSQFETVFDIGNKKEKKRDDSRNQRHHRQRLLHGVEGDEKGKGEREK